MLERVLGIGKTGNRFVDRNKGIVMETYDLKDSGVDWLGSIPKHWSVKRIKDIVDLKSGNSITSFQIQSEGLYPVYGGNGLRGYTDSYTHSGYKILIGRQGDLCGNINYVKGEFFATEHAVVCNPYFDLNVFWLGELLRSMNLNQYSNAAAQAGLSVSKIKNLKIPVPTKEEQKAIADYLHKACQNIDKTITLKQQQLDKLEAYRKSVIHEAVTKGLDKTVPMKDSGVEWLGEIPEHWKSDRLKDFVIFNPTKNPARIKENEVVSIFPMEFISENGEILGRNEAIYKETDTGLNYFENGDVIFAKITPCMENGKGALIKDIPTRISLGSTEFFVLRPTFLVNAEYLYYLTRNQYFRDFLEKNMKGAAGQQRVPAKFFKYTVLPLPNIEEQKAIADYLDKACTNIDKTKETIAKQIKTLTQYRQSLIHECVTGKKRVYQGTN